MKGWVVAALIALIIVVFGGVVFAVWGTRTSAKITRSEEAVALAFDITRAAYEYRIVVCKPIAGLAGSNALFMRVYGEYQRAVTNRIAHIEAMNAGAEMLHRPASLLEYYTNQVAFKTEIDAMTRRMARVSNILKNPAYSNSLALLQNAEKEIELSVTAVNAALREYNALVGRFPSSVVAGARAKLTRPLFDQTNW